MSRCQRFYLSKGWRIMLRVSFFWFVLTSATHLARHFYTHQPLEPEIFGQLVLGLGLALVWGAVIVLAQRGHVLSQQWLRGMRFVAYVGIVFLAVGFVMSVARLFAAVA